MKIKIILAILFYTIGSTPSHAIVPSFYLINKNAKMPVVIRGNIQSEVLIVFLHGGPGGTALKKIGTRAFSKLEEDFGVVYWEQRGADKSKGGTQPKYMNLNQYVEDLNKLIDQLCILYPHSSIFLMGHCWGGGLATAYLSDTNRQKKIKGWINVAGAYNNPKGDSLSAEWVKSYAHRMIASGENIQYWKKALMWYAKNPKFTSAQLKHYSFVREANGYQCVKGDTLGLYPCYTRNDIVLKPGQYINYHLNYYKTLTRFLISDIDLSAEMKKITIPSLIIWGEEDGLVPIEMGYEAYTLLGTATDKKHFVIFKRTAHTVHYEQPVLFARSVKEFIDRQSNKEFDPFYKKIISF